MTQVTAFETSIAASVGEGASHAPTSPQRAPTARKTTLRRTGARPLQFVGAELCSAMSYGPGSTFWYEVNLFQTADQKFIVDIRLFSKTGEDQDRFFVKMVSSFDEVMDYLETYEPANDLRVDLAIDDEGTPIAELCLQAVSLRARIHDARRQFRSIVGEVLYELDRT